MLGCLILILLEVPFAKEAAFLGVLENGMTKRITLLLAGVGTVFITDGFIDLTFICHFVLGQAFNLVHVFVRRN